MSKIKTNCTNGKYTKDANINFLAESSVIFLYKVTAMLKNQIPAIDTKTAAIIDNCKLPVIPNTGNTERFHEVQIMFY